MKNKFAAFALCALGFSAQAMNNDGDDELQRAIQLSLQENGNWENPSEFEDLELQQALELSKQQNIVNDDEEELRQALELSKQQNVVGQNDDELQKVLQSSMKDLENQDKDNLNLILQQSRLEAQQNGNYLRGFQVEDEEKEYQRILQESKFLAMMNNIKNKNDK